MSIWRHETVTAFSLGYNQKTYAYKRVISIIIYSFMYAYCLHIFVYIFAHNKSKQPCCSMFAAS